MSSFTGDEMMVIAASRTLENGDVCFVGVGTPSEVCNLARLTHARDIELIYESGTIGARPNVLPLSVADNELCETALATVSVTEMFRYWIQGGRIPLVVLGAAQIDRFGNINSTVIGEYRQPRVRLPGGGGAPELATSCGQVRVTMKQSKRAMVESLDFLTTYGHGRGGADRARAGIETKGPTLLITDRAIWKPDPETRELTVVSLHPGTTLHSMTETVSWKVRYADDVVETPPPTLDELAKLRDLRARTIAAHAGTVEA